MVILWDSFPVALAHLLVDIHYFEEVTYFFSSMEGRVVSFDHTRPEVADETAVV